MAAPPRQQCHGAGHRQQRALAAPGWLAVVALVVAVAPAALHLVLAVLLLVLSGCGGRCRCCCLSRHLAAGRPHPPRPCCHQRLSPRIAERLPSPPLLLHLQIIAGPALLAATAAAAAGAAQVGQE